MRRPIFFDEDITTGEIAEAMRAAGLHMHTEAGLRLVVDRVPGILAKDKPLTNVVPLARRKAGR